VLVALFLPPAISAQQPGPQNAFTIRDASRLVTQLAGALEAHELNNFLSTFDLTRMNGGELFKQQIVSLFAHADSIRVHLNLTEVGTNVGKSTATVEGEIETAPADDNTPPVRKHATLQFTAERISAMWRFTDVQPRTFFSTSTPPKAQPSQ
jgi:hypothetical protein